MKSILLILFIFLPSLNGCKAQENTSTDNLTQIEMLTRRAAHTTTLLENGKALIAGGLQDNGRGDEISLRSAEIFDPETGKFTKTGDMNEPHSSHTAILLPDGRVLIAGGWAENERSSTLEIYDPVDGSFSIVGHLSSPRAGTSSTLLKNGKVLITGGASGKDTYLNTAEIFDPETNKLTPTGNLSTARYTHTATLLDDGNVLITGGRSGNGVLSGTEIYDPEAGIFSPAADMNSIRYKHAAVMMNDGNVLIIGGSDERDWKGKYKTAEIYFPKENKFISASNLSGERFKLSDAVALLPGGKVLIAGGNNKVEVYNPINDSFTEIGQLPDDYYYTTATPLNNGTILIAGGYNNSILATSSAWIYKD